VRRGGTELSGSLRPAISSIRPCVAVCRSDQRDSLRAFPPAVTPGAVFSHDVQAATLILKG